MLNHAHSKQQAPKRTVVIGSGGFVGGAVMKRLAVAGAPALGLGRAEVDLLAKGASEKLMAYLQPGDAVVAASAIAPCKNIDMLADNMTLVRTVVSALANGPELAHVVNISSDAVYADSLDPLTEDSVKAPDNPHGVMHLAREIAFQSLDTPLAILRPSLLYGANDPHNGYGPNRFRRLASEGKEIELFGEGEERRDHVLIDDVAEIVWRVLAHGSTGTLNIATGDVMSFRDISEKVVALSGNDVAIKGSPRNGPMPHDGYRPFDAAATKAAFSDFAYTRLADGLAQVQEETTQRNSKEPS